MIYEMKCYTSKATWEDEEDSYVIAWETKTKQPDNCIAISGKLLMCLGYPKKTYEVPNGIETIGSCVFAKPDWDVFDSEVETVKIPASVTKIEEGAFEWTNISKIVIDKDSPAGVVKNKALYTKDGKTLLHVLELNDNGEYVVPDGVTRIGLCAISRGTIIIPQSVTEIAMDADHEYAYDAVKIKAPSDSYAIKFAQKNNLDYEEI